MNDRLIQTLVVKSKRESEIELDRQIEREKKNIQKVIIYITPVYVASKGKKENWKYQLYVNFSFVVRQERQDMMRFTVLCLPTVKEGNKKGKTETIGDCDTVKWIDKRNRQTEGIQERLRKRKR